VAGVVADAAAAEDAAVAVDDDDDAHRSGGGAAGAAPVSPPPGLPPLLPHATDAFMDDAPPPPPPPEVPESLLGRRVRRVFEGGVPWVGDITRLRRTEPYGTLWHVLYSDGDSEELMWQDLHKALLPLEEPAAAAAEAVPALPARADAAPQLEAAGPRHRAAPRAPSAAAAPANTRTRQRQQQGSGVAIASPTTRAPLSPPAPPMRQYKCVYPEGKTFKVEYYAHGRRLYHGGYRTAAEAARAYDDAMRALGRRVVNFPRPGSGEVQAVRNQAHDVTLREALAAAGGAGSAKPPAAAARAGGAGGGAGGAAYRRAAAAPLAPQMHASERHYRGVRRVQTADGIRYRAELLERGEPRLTLGCFRTAEDAARAIDVKARKRGLLHRLNFPATAAERVSVAAWLAQPRQLAVAARQGTSFYHDPLAGASGVHSGGGGGAAVACATAAAAAQAMAQRRHAHGGAGGAGADADASEDEDEDDDAGGSSSSSDSDSRRERLLIGARAAVAALKYRGVRSIMTGGAVRFHAELCVAEPRMTLKLGCHFRTAEDAARAIDAEARRRGIAHLVHFPKNGAERAAVAEYNARQCVVVAASLRAAKRAQAVAALAALHRGKTRRADAQADDDAGAGGAAGAERAKRARVTAEEDAGGAASAPPDSDDAAAAPSTHAGNAGVVAPPAPAAPAPPAAAPAAALAALPAAVPAAPPAAPPAAAAPAGNHAAAGQGAEAAHSNDDDTAQLLSFLRSVTPSLSNLPAVMDAARGSGITLAHLAQLAQLASSPAAPQRLVLDIALNGLRIESIGDKLAFTMALAGLLHGGGGGGGGGVLSH
jgi:hypothetical protein